MTILAVMGLKLQRRVGDSFFAPGFGINQIDNSKESQIIITDPQAWFDQPEQSDLKTDDYYIL